MGVQEYKVEKGLKPPMYAGRNKYLPTVQISLDSWWWHFLENYVYQIPKPPPRQRTKPMEVICVGLPRSGTESLQQALMLLGYDHT